MSRHGRRRAMIRCCDTVAARTTRPSERDMGFGSRYNFCIVTWGATFGVAILRSKAVIQLNSSL